MSLEKVKMSLDEKCFCENKGKIAKLYTMFQRKKDIFALPVIYLWFFGIYICAGLHGLRAIPGGAQGIFLALTGTSGLCLVNLGNIWGSRDWTWVSHLQGEHPTQCIITLDPALHILNSIQIFLTLNHCSLFVLYIKLPVIQKFIKRRK